MATRKPISKVSSGAYNSKWSEKNKNILSTTKKN